MNTTILAAAQKKIIPVVYGRLKRWEALNPLAHSNTTQLFLQCLTCAETKMQ